MTELTKRVSAPRTLRDGGEGFDFLGFEHRWVRARGDPSRTIAFLARWPSRQGMQHARDRIRELTARERLLLPVETVVQDVNRFLRPSSGYFRYGNSARPFDRIQTYALGRLALFVAKRHKRLRGYGWWAVAYQPSDRLGLINLNGTVVAPRPNWGWRKKPNAGGEGTSVSRVRENRMHGSMGGSWKRSAATVTRTWAPGGNAGAVRRGLPPFNAAAPGPYTAAVLQASSPPEARLPNYV